MSDWGKIKGELHFKITAFIPFHFLEVLMFFHRVEDQIFLVNTITEVFSCINSIQRGASLVLTKRR